MNLVHTEHVPGENDPAETRLGDTLDLLAALIAGGLIAMTYADRSGLPRILLTLAFAFFVPGRAIVTNWTRMALWSQAALAMVLSLAVLTLLATITLWAHLWHPLPLFRAEAWLSLACLTVGIARRHTRRPGMAAIQPRSAPPDGR